MTGIEIFLLLAGCVFMVGSFFITEKLSPSELNKIAELSQEELRRIVDSEIQNAGPRIEEKVDDQIDASSDLVQRALEKETNLKIMAISDYSDTVIENMNKTHNEIVFLYSMLNDKHTELTQFSSNLQELASELQKRDEEISKHLAQRIVPEEIKEPPKAVKTQQSLKPALEEPKVFKEAKREEDFWPEEEFDDLEEINHNAAILALKEEGKSAIEIARELALGLGEVQLVIGLYEGKKEQ